MKAYKGFTKDMKCRDFQYEEGKTYEESEAKLCRKGFHACEAPIDCLRYYDPAHSVYHEVELDATDEKESEDTKRVGKRIKIGAQLDIPHLCKVQFEYVKSHCTNENNADPGKPATAGYRGAATAGNYGAATSRGRSAVGENGIACARGNHVRVKGGMGAVLVIAEENESDYDIAHWKAFVIDGKQYKADTWYTFKDGELVEVSDEDEQ